MPTVYRDGMNVRELKGSAQGGLVVTIHDPQELSRLQDLVKATARLPGEPLDTLYRVVANAGASLANWLRADGVPPDIATQAERPTSGPKVRRTEGTASSVPHSKETGIDDAKARALYGALELAGRAWTNQGGNADDLACALMLRRPGRRLRFESRRPSLTLDYGSVRPRVLTGGGKLRAFGVALFPVARSRRQIDLVEALRAGATGIRLPRLESIRRADLEGKSGVVIFLHGLMSTDVGTFDSLVERLRRDPSLLLVAWPHDTLDEIELNAAMLAEEIPRRVGPSLPIAFVGHSRGGLVARRTAVNLMKSSDWKARVRGCVTFGTPHHGAELAESGDEFVGKLLLLRTVMGQAGTVPLVDALYTVAQSSRLRGVSDLRPRKNGGAFLSRLIEAEGTLAGESGAMPMPVFAVGGAVEGRGILGWLTTRFFRNAPNDFVVTLASSAPEELPRRAEVRSDHFSYFDVTAGRDNQTGEAVRFLHDVLAPLHQGGRRRRVSRHGQPRSSGAGMAAGSVALQH